MPSLWDLLCVSRQNKYTTDGKPTRHGPSRWDDPPYYDPSNVEYYIQPDISSPRRVERPPPATAVQCVSVPPPRSPSSRRNLRVHESPRPDRRPWYVEVRVPQSPSPAKEVTTHEGDHAPSWRNQHDSKALPASPRGGSHHVSGQQNSVDRNSEYTADTGKRRHVRDIFADVSPQYQENAHRVLAPALTSTESIGSHHTAELVRASPDRSGPRSSSGSTQRSGQELDPRSRQIYASRQTSGLPHHIQSGHSSPYPQPDDSRPTPPYRQHAPPRQSVQSRQASAYPPAMGSGQSSGWTHTTGPRPSPRMNPPESMHQYSPRTVSDSAISAALFGGRIDDFVHDPSWNKAITRFATSPTSTTSAFSFEDKSFPRHTNRHGSSSTTVSPQDSDGNITFVVPPQQPKSSKPRHYNKEPIHPEGRTTPQSSGTALPVYRDSPDRMGVVGADSKLRDKQGHALHLDKVRTRSSESGFQISAGSGQDIPLFWNPEEDVLY